MIWSGHRAGVWDGVLKLLLAAAVAVVVAACGGGASNPDPGPQAPFITSQLTDLSVLEGSSATFSIAAVGSAPIAYQWFGSADAAAPFVAIAGATAPVHTIAATTYSQNGTRYRVVVSNSAGSVVSSAVSLIVSSSAVAPKIAVQPADISVTAPATAHFAVTASGTSPSYVWYSSPDGTTYTPVGGANAPTLDVPNTDIAMNGFRYAVRVQNIAGSETSAPATLTVRPAAIAPAFTTQPLSQSITAGQGVNFIVAASGTPAPTLAWRLNGATLVDGVQAAGACAGAIVAGATSTTLSLVNVPLTCSGALFSAVASNGTQPDAVSTNASLTVTRAPSPPVITLQPSDITVIAPTTATFTAAASGVPTPAVQWQVSTDGGNTFNNINGATATSYTTPATTANDDGKQFRAVFANTSGSATTRAALLTVSTAPRITLHPVSAVVDAPNTVTYTAAAVANPAATVKWQSSLDCGATFSDIVGATNPSYTTPATTLVDTGKRFRAVFSNTAGSAITTSAQLTASPQASVLSLLAGDIRGRGNVDGTGISAHLVFPTQVAVDGSGNVFIAESGTVSDDANHTVRKSTPAGVVTTVAGQTKVPGTADGACTPSLNNPNGVVVDAAGNTYISDTDNSSIRKVTPEGVVSTYAGLSGTSGSADGTGTAARFNHPQQLAIDAAGNLYVADHFNHIIRKITPQQVVTTLAGQAGVAGSTDGNGSAALFFNPHGIAVDSTGTIYVADTDNDTIRKITPAGDVTTLAGTALNPGSADGTGPAAQFIHPFAIAVDSSTGELYVTDTDNHTIRKITAAGVVTTWAGTVGSVGNADGTGAAAQFNFPHGVAFDATSGNVYVGDTFNHTLRKITPARVVTTLAGGVQTTGAVDATGPAARFFGVFGVTADGQGNVYVSDGYNSTIRMVTPAGQVTTIAGSAGLSGSADGIGSAARFFSPEGMAFDPQTGNLFVVDSSNQTIRMITSQGLVTTLAGLAGSSGSADGMGSAARFFDPRGIAFDPQTGNVFVADVNNHTIRMITPAGDVTTIAGLAGAQGTNDGPALSARFTFPSGVAFDPVTRNLYIADISAIRVLDANGQVTTIAGSDSTQGSTDGLGNVALFGAGLSIAVDPTTGTLYVGEISNQSIRKVTTAGQVIVTTIAGAPNESGIRPGTVGRLQFVQAVAVINPTKLAIAVFTSVLALDLH